MVVDSLIAPSLFRWATNKRAAPRTHRGQHISSHALCSYQRCFNGSVDAPPASISSPIFLCGHTAARLPVWLSATRSRYSCLIQSIVQISPAWPCHHWSMHRSSRPSPHRGQPFVLHSKHRNIMIAACATATGPLCVVALWVSHQLKHASCSVDSNCTDARALYALPVMTSTHRVSTFVINLAVGPCSDFSGRLSLDHHSSKDANGSLELLFIYSRLTRAF